MYLLVGFAGATEQNSFFSVAFYIRFSVSFQNMGMLVQLLSILLMIISFSKQL